MKLKLLLFLLLWSGMAHAANLYTFNGGGTVGNWNASSTWTTDATGSTQVNAAVPGTNDVVTILNGYTVSLTANVPTTGLELTIQQGGVLNMSIFTMATLKSLSGQGTLRLKSASFPGITTNNFANAGAGTVEYYDLTTGTALPATVAAYNNLRVLNSTAAAIVVTLGSTLTVQGTFTLLRTGGAGLTFNLTGTSPLTIVGDLNVGAGTTLGLSGNGAHAVTLSGNEVVAASGTLNFTATAPATGTADITFTGAADRTLTNNGTTRLNSLTVNKGVGQQFVQSIVSASGATLTVNTSLDNVVTLTNGTLRLGSNITLPTLINNTNGNNGYEIPANAGLWIDGATVSLPSNVNGGLISQGLFRISAGSFTSQGNDGTVIGDAGSYVIEGGTVTTEKFSTVKSGTPLGSFAMTGGTFNAKGTGANLNNQKGFARFSLPYATQVYNVSGGTINVYNAEDSGTGASSGVEIATGIGNYSVTGGDFNIILPGTGQSSNIAFKLASTAPFWNLTIIKPVSTSTTLVSLAATANVAVQPLVVLKDLTLSGANTPTLQANGQGVTVQGNFTVGSTAVYNPGLNTTSFTGGRNHFFIVDGTVTSGVYNLVIDKPAGSLSLAGTAVPFPQVRNELRILSGVMDDGGKELKVLGNVLNSAIHTSSGGSGSVTLAGTALQTLDGDGNGVFGNLYLDNSTLAVGSVAVQMLAAQAVSDKLLFKKNHILDIGTNRLSITSISTTAVATSGTGVSFSNQCLIRTAGNQSDGGLRKTFGSFDANNAAAFLYPVGSVAVVAGTATTVYTPASIGITAQPSRYGKITVAPVSVQNPFVTSTTQALRYYWAVSSIDFVGLPTGKITHRYSAPRTLVSGTLANYVPAYYAPTKWTIVGTTANVDKAISTTYFDTYFNNVDIDGQYTAGESGAFGVITAYYSRVAAGNWETPATWSTDGTLKYAGAASTTTPTASNPVFIGDGATYNHVVTVTANGAQSGSLEIASGSTLDVGVRTGNNFGSLPNAKVQGAGRLRISSAAGVSPAVFPGGDFGNFLGPRGGTV